MIEIRKAVEGDVDGIISFDQVAQREEQRRSFIFDSVRNGTAWVAVLANHVVGYAVLEYTFYGRGFISMLYIHPKHRGKDFGTALVQHLEGVCRTEKLFTSTNESNRPMHALLVKEGYVPSGIINNLDPGDPEIVYFKQLRASDNEGV